MTHNMQVGKKKGKKYSGALDSFKEDLSTFRTRHFLSIFANMDSHFTAYVESKTLKTLKYTFVTANTTPALTRTVHLSGQEVKTLF